MNPMLKYGIVAVAAFVGWAIGKNIDGPVVHWLLTILLAWIAWGQVSKMDSGGM